MSHVLRTSLKWASIQMAIIAIYSPHCSSFKSTKRKKLCIIISVNGHLSNFKLQMLIKICSGDNHKSPTDSVVIEKSLDWATPSRVLICNQVKSYSSEARSKKFLFERQKFNPKWESNTTGVPWEISKSLTCKAYLSSFVVT